MSRITLGEGNTPLVESARIGPSLGLDRLWFKLENCNPSGSYKDRFVAAEMTRMLASGVRGCIATSSGNTGSALAGALGFPQGVVRANLWEVEYTYNFAKRSMFGSTAVRPYIV